MILKRRTLSRRAVLRGAGATLALPLLEIMQSRGYAAGTSKARPPVRAGFFYIPNGVVQRAWHPVDEGKNFTLSPSLKPLESVRDHISLYTKLDRVKVAGTDGHAQAGACWATAGR